MLVSKRSKMGTKVWGRAVPVMLVMLLIWCGEEPYGQGTKGALDKLPKDKACEGNATSLDVTSERMTFESKTRIFLFEEKVKVVRCAMTIHCDRLQVLNAANEKNVERIIATGNVQFRQGNRSASADRADYFEAEQKVILTGNPRVWDTQERDELTGEEITLWLQEEKVSVKQARVLFHPRKTSLKTP